MEKPGRRHVVSPLVATSYDYFGKIRERAVRGVDKSGSSRYNTRIRKNEKEKGNNGNTTCNQHDNNNGNRRALALQQLQMARMGQNLIWNNSRKANGWS